MEVEAKLVCIDHRSRVLPISTFRGNRAKFHNDTPGRSPMSILQMELISLCQEAPSRITSSGK